MSVMGGGARKNEAKLFSVSERRRRRWLYDDNVVVCRFFMKFWGRGRMRWVNCPDVRSLSNSN